MIELIVFALVCFGIAWGLGQSGLSYPIRLRINPRSRHSRFYSARTLVIALLECPGCIGFHTGWVFYVLGVTPRELPTWWIAAFAVTSSNLLLYKLTGLADSAPPEGGDDRRAEGEDPPDGG